MDFKGLATKDLFLLVSGILGGIFIKGVWNIIVFGIIIYLLAQCVNFFSTRKKANNIDEPHY